MLSPYQSWGLGSANASLDVVRELRDGESRKMRCDLRALMPAILRCVEAGATVGEICGRLEQVFGSYRPKAAI